MSSSYLIQVHRMGGGYYHFSLKFHPELLNVSAIIIDAGSLDGQKKLLSFVDNVIGGQTSKEEYWTNGFTAKVIRKNGHKMLKIFFRLTNDEKPCQVSLLKLRELLGSWIREREKFEKDPEVYKQELVRNGAIVVYPEDREKDPAAYDERIREAKHGVIEEVRPKKWWQDTRY